MSTPEDRFPTDREATAAAYRLVICGVDELARFRQCGFSHIVSIMDPGSAVPEIFGSFDAHERLDLRFHDIIDQQADLVIPNKDHIGQLLRFADAMIAPKSPVTLLVHCHAGVSRSSAAAVLLLAGTQPNAPEWALAQLLTVAPNAWPNLRMIELGDALTDGRGRLISAVRAHYASMLERYPAIRQLIAIDRHLRVSPE